MALLLNMAIPSRLQASCIVGTSPISRTHGYAAATNFVSVQASNGCSWQVVNTNAWITILSAPNGTNSGTVLYAISDNLSLTNRTGVILINDRTFTLTQVASPGCTYSLSPTAQVFDRGPATGVINIGTLGGCAWSMVNSNRWIAFTSGTSGTNSQSLTYWVDANPTLLSRTGVLQIANRTFTVSVRGLASLTVRLLGANPMTNEFMKVFTDPGAVADSGPLGLAAGAAHSLAMRSDGTVAAWGNNGAGQTAVPASLGNVVSIAAGGEHSLALQRGGSVVAWGDNQYGQSTVPIGLNNVEGIAAGLHHSLALQADGSVMAWGDNSHGQTEPLAGSQVTAVAAGHYHSLALHSDGTVAAWGEYWNGSTYVLMTVPGGLSNVAAVAAGDSHCLALLRNGTVFSWGNNTAGQTSVPGGLIDAIAIAGGSVHSLALRRDGTVVAWGGNSDGQAAVPTGLNNVVAIAAGGSHSLALRRDGAVFAWGRNNSGQTDVPGGLGSSVTGGHIGVSGFVDTNSAGIYTLTYTATDSAGNTATATRTVVVVDNTPAPASVDPNWVARYYPQDDANEVVALAVDKFGNIHVAGASHADTNNTEYVVLKYDPNGHKLWEARSGSLSFDQARAMAVDGADNVYVTGESSGQQYDYLTVKFDTDGRQLWSARYDGGVSSDDRATSLAVDGTGQVYVTGRSQNSSARYDYATIKYDANGNELWVARYNGPYGSDDRAVAVGVDAAGNVYVTGTSINSGVGDDYATVKYDADGHELWVVRYHGPIRGGNDYPTALAVDSVGNVYVTGYSWSSTGSDYATVKYNTYGNQLWVARYNGPGNSEDRPAALAIDSAGQVYVTGYSTGKSTGADYATVKYAPDGRELWVARYNGPGNSLDRAEALGVDGAGKVYVTGASGLGYATVSYDAGGNQCWVGRYRGPGTNPDSAVALGLDSSGNVYVTGENGGYPNSYTSGTFATLKYTNSVPEGAPIITLGPETQVALPGDTVSFHVEASGAAPLSYQWRFNGINIPGATNATLLLPSFQTSQVGDYSVVVTNDMGFALSLEAHLTGGSPPAMVAAAWVGYYDEREGFAEEARALALDSAGNVYITGTAGTAKYGPDGNRFWIAGGNGVAIAVDSTGQACVTGPSIGGNTTTKYDIYGNVLWVAPYPAAANENITITALVLDAADNVYIAGHFSSGGNSDYVTVKYDRNGHQLWTARYDGPNHRQDWATSMAVDSAGNVYVTGYSYLASGDGSDSDSDFLTIKYDPNGNQIWLARYDGPGSADDFGRLVALDSAGHVYVTGSSVGSGGDFDYATVKYDTNGHQLWVARYDGVGHAEDKARGLAIDKDGNAYVTGYSTGVGTSYDYATVKYAPDGQQLWAARYNGPANGGDQPVALALDRAGFVYITGRSPAGVYNNSRAYDWATIKYAPNGTRLWVARYDQEQGRGGGAAALAVDSSGTVYVTGWSYQDSTHVDYTTVKYVQTDIEGCPALALLPQSQAVPLGANVTFNAQASGLMPLSYRWTFNGTNLFSATNATLSLTNVQLAQAGDYTIVVSNAIGEISSPIAQLKVLGAVLSLRWQTNPAAVVLEWPANALGYQLEMAESLRIPNWSSIPNAVVTNGVNRVTIDQPSGGRFFRLRKE